MKKLTHFLVTVALILGLTQPTFAHPIPCGPYFGLDAGVAHFHSSLHYRDATNSLNQDLTLSAAGFHGNLMLGWAFLMSNWYFALDGFFGLHTANNDVKVKVDDAADDFLKFSLRNRYQFGGAFNVGYMLMQTLFFIRLGLSFSNFKFESQFINNGVNDSNFDVSKNRTLVGFMPGVGMAMMLSETLMLSALFTYAFYRSHTFKGLARNATDNFPEARISPRVAAFTVGLTWFFAQSMGGVFGRG